ncbi:MAG: hypothetical protein REH79_00360 [Spiroplasma sp.]|nr:hypothetical protein [Spiroplasma sp.]
MENKWQKITEDYSSLSSVINDRLNENYHLRRMHNVFYKWVIDLYIFFNYDFLKLGSLFIEFFEKNKKHIRPCMLFDSFSLLHNTKDFKLLELFLKNKNIPFNIEFPDYASWTEKDIKLLDKILTLNSEEDLVIKLFWFTVYHYCPIEILQSFSLNSELESAKKINFILKEISNVKDNIYALSQMNEEFKNALEYIFQGTGAHFFGLENIFFKDKTVFPFTFADFREYSRNKWDSWIFEAFEEKNKFLAKSIKISDFKNINIVPEKTSLLVGNGFSVEIQTEKWLFPEIIFGKAIKNYSKFYQLFYNQGKTKSIAFVLKELDDFLKLGKITKNEISLIKEKNVASIEEYYFNLKPSDIKKHIELLKETAIEIINIYLKNDFSSNSVLKINTKESKDFNKNRVFNYFSNKYNKTVFIHERWIWHLLKINWNDNVYYEDLALVNDLFKRKEINDIFNDFHFIFRSCYLEAVWNEGKSWNKDFIKPLNEEKMNKIFKGNIYSTNYDGFIDFIMNQKVNHLHGSFNLWKSRENYIEEYIEPFKVNKNFQTYLNKHGLAKSSIILSSPIDKDNFLNFQIKNGFSTLGIWVNNYKNDQSETLVVVGNNFFKDYWIYKSVKNNKNLKRLVITFYGNKEKERFIKEIPDYLEELIRTDIEIILCDSKTFFDFFK